MEPKIRFKDFSGDWRTFKLEEVAFFLKGKGISKSEISEDGNIPCIRYGQLYTDYSEVINNVKSKTNTPKSELIFSEENDVIIPSSGETAIDIATASCVLNKGIALGGDLNIIRSTQNGVFIAFYLNNKKKLDIARLAQGKSVIHIYNSSLKTLNINLPTLPEQQKIASFLSAVDQRIEILQKKRELLQQYKKGVMQQIFSQQIRFKQDDGTPFPDWEEKKLEEIGNAFNGLQGKTKDDFGNGDNYITYKQIFDNSKIDTSSFEKVFINEGETQNMVKFGDVFFTTSSETRLEVAYSSILLDDVKNTYLNSFCFGFRINSFDELSPYFARFLFRSQNFRKKVTVLGQGSTRYNISKTSFLKLIVSIPDFKEQQKIANFLSTIDSKLEVLEKQITRTQQFKKGLLQQMFV